MKAQSLCSIEVLPDLIAVSNSFHLKEVEKGFACTQNKLYLECKKTVTKK